VFAAGVMADSDDYSEDAEGGENDEELSDGEDDDVGDSDDGFEYQGDEISHGCRVCSVVVVHIRVYTR
jgi:hypothetical protein